MLRVPNNPNYATKPDKVVPHGLYWGETASIELSSINVISLITYKRQIIYIMLVFSSLFFMITTQQNWKAYIMYGIIPLSCPAIEPSLYALTSILYFTYKFGQINNIPLLVEINAPQCLTTLFVNFSIIHWQ